MKSAIKLLFNTSWQKVLLFLAENVGEEYLEKEIAQTPTPEQGTAGAEAGIGGAEAGGLGGGPEAGAAPEAGGVGAAPAPVPL